MRRRCKIPHDFAMSYAKPMSGYIAYLKKVRLMQSYVKVRQCGAALGY